MGENEGFSNPLLMIMNQHNPSSVLEAGLNSDNPQDPEILRTTLFFFSHYPPIFYEAINSTSLNEFFSYLVPRLDLVCDSNANFLQSFFALFNLEQKLYGLDIKSEPIRTFLTEKRNYNVHYEMMSADELVLVALSVTWLFQDCPEEYIKFFDENILQYLEPLVEDLKSEELSKLFVALSQFGYSKLIFGILY